MTILLVEDDQDDVFALKWALKKAQLAPPIQHVGDGREAIRYLSGEGDYADRTRFPLPALVLLDLKLPYRTGIEVLTWIREQAELAELPVVILSGSDEARDHERTRALRVQDYLVKPPSPEGIRGVLERAGCA